MTEEKKNKDPEKDAATAGEKAEAPKSAPAPKPSIIKPPEYQVASSPHLHSGASVHSIMWTVFLALLPAALAGVYYFGWKGLTVLVASTAGAMAVEGIYQTIMKQRVTVSDGSAAVTGLLLGMNLPPSSPLWMVLVGSFVAVFIAKQVFGGLGYNPFNPALVARVFLLISFPVQMTKWSAPDPLFKPFFAFLVPAPDAFSGASPLGAVKMQLLTENTATVAANLNILDALLGAIPGSAGETSALFLIAGGIFLIGKRIITWHIPVSYIGTVAVMATIFHAVNPEKYPGADFHLVTGGLMIGAFFMATDYVTSPVSPRGMLIFGFGCGFITMAIRYFGGYPEGVSFAILLMNMCVPLIDTYTQPRVFGEVKSRA